MSALRRIDKQSIEPLVTRNRSPRVRLQALCSPGGGRIGVLKSVSVVS
jgi:hypothetical protein